MPEVNVSWPSQTAAGTRPVPVRANARRNRARLLAAAGKLLSAGGAFTLAEVASEAGVSTATAYRHFTSAEEVADAFIAGFLDDVEQRVTDAAPILEPEVRIAQLNAIWVATVLDWGPALAHLRSPEGFLARRARGEPDVIRSLCHVEPALVALLGDSADTEQISYAVAVWNALADPREILDQRAVLGWSVDEITGRLDAAVLTTCAASGLTASPITLGE